MYVSQIFRGLEKFSKLSYPNGLRLKKRTMHLTNYSVPWILETFRIRDAMDDMLIPMNLKKATGPEMCKLRTPFIESG